MSCSWNIISLREHPEQLERFLQDFPLHWGNEPVYRNCMEASLKTDSPLPQWFLAESPDGETAGCAGLGGQLILHTAKAAELAGYRELFCCTDHTGYYEKYGFCYIGTGFHPWGESSRIYCLRLKGKIKHE